MLAHQPVGVLQNSFSFVFQSLAQSIELMRIKVRQFQRWLLNQFLHFHGANYNASLAAQLAREILERRRPVAANSMVR